MRYVYQVSYCKDNDYQAIVRFYIDADTYEEADKIAKAKEISLRDNNPFFRTKSTMIRCVSINDGNMIIRIED